MARPANNTRNTKNIDILRYALTHLERERDDILQKISHITQQLGDRIAPHAGEPAQATAAAAPRKKRVLSAAARKRIAAAQKKRWEAHRKAKAQ
jgi:hypothetical protein